MAGAERKVVGINEDYLRRKPNGMKTAGATAYNYSQAQHETDARITAPATEAAKQWEGWGTALKPAWEPISIFTKDGPLTLHADFKRLYYCAKASKKERNLGLASGIANGHPTIKPLKLMENLCELATPKGGVILDPFMGSGTTGIAALNRGFNFVGIDMVEDYFNVAQTRLSSLYGGSGQ